MTWRVVVGTLAFALTMILFGYVLVTEQGRMAAFAQSYDSRQVEAGATLYESNCSLCHGNQGQGVGGFGPSLNALDLFDGSRLKGYAGSVEDYIRATVASGRPVPSAGATYGTNRMPTWSDRFGGPLREDQVNSLVAFIMNWQSTAGAATPVPTGPVYGTDIKAALPEGDPTGGQGLATSLACVNCHVTAGVGPAWLEAPQIGARAETRITESGYAGTATSAREYLIEAIVLPNTHVVSSFNPDIMPKDYGSKLTPQQIADLVAYLLSLK